jgi:hypothetical protein
MASGKNLTVYLTSDVTKFRRGMTSASRSARSFGDTTKRVMGGVGLAVAAVGAVAAKELVDAVGKASNLAEATSKAGVIFKRSAARVQEWAEDAAYNMGLAETAALDAASGFGALAKQAGIKRGAVAAFATEMATLAGDLASFSNTSVEDAVAALQSGLRGEAEPLRRFNINLSEGAIMAEALASGLVKAEKDTLKVKSAQLSAQRAQDAYSAAVRKSGPNSVTAERALAALEIAQLRLSKATKGSVPQLTDQQKIVARTQVIMKQGKDAAGDFDRTRQGIANTSKIISAEIENLQTDLGTGFLEGVGGFEEGTGRVVTGLEEMRDEAAETGRKLGELTRGALDTLGAFAKGVSAIPILFNGATTLLGDLYDFGLDKVGLISDEEGAKRKAANARRLAELNHQGLVLANDYVQNVRPGATGSTSVNLYNPADDLYTGDPVRSRSNRQVRDGRSNARAAQREARTGNRP